jgi:pyridoxal phosphate enzyme (YggS family)
MHQIGTLQRNKVKLVLPFCKTIQSVDSLKLAKEIAKTAEALNLTADVLIEVNSAKEEQKSGVMPDEVESLISEIQLLPRIRVKGLMTMGPVCENPELLRPYFKSTRKLFDKLFDRFGEGAILSMGMSDSYLVAIEEGANLVRVGRALFNK